MLESEFLYIWVDFFCIIFPFLFSFHPKIKFYKQWNNFIIPCLFVALFFIIWDATFTKMKIWWFNYDYLMGFKILNLPIEEILFFICIPYACVFTYYCVELFFQKYTISNILSSLITYILITICLIGLIKYYDRWYTATTCILLMATLVYLKFKKTTYLGKFYISYLLIIIPFLTSNGILTGGFTIKPVVIYNNLENISYRFFTIPFEDFLYGMLLILLNVVLFEYNKSKSLKLN